MHDGYMVDSWWICRVWLCSETATREITDYEKMKASEVGHVINRSQWIAVAQCAAVCLSSIYHSDIVFGYLKFFCHKAHCERLPQQRRNVWRRTFLLGSNFVGFQTYFLFWNCSIQSNIRYKKVGWNTASLPVMPKLGNPLQSDSY